MTWANALAAQRVEHMADFLVREYRGLPAQDKFLTQPRRQPELRCWLRYVALACALSCTARPVIAAGVPHVEWTFQCGSPIYSSPVVVDLTASPGLEILVVSSSQRKCFCLSSARKVLWVYDKFTLRVTSTPTVADLDQDGTLEVLITTRDDGVLCLRADGTRWWQSSVQDHIPWGNVSVADANGDGLAEVYWVATAGALECHAGDGTTTWTLPIPGGGSFGPLAVGDIDRDNRPEIVACGGRHTVYCLDAVAKQRWRFEAMSACNSGPVIADVTGDPHPEVFVASNDGVFYCLDGRTGDVVWNHRTFQGRIDTTIAVGDINGDGQREVLYGDGMGHLYCLDGHGAELWAFTSGDWIENAPVLGDVDGDGHVDVVFGSANGNVYSLSERGHLQWCFPTGKRVSASPTLCDHDGDGTVDILVASHNGVLYCLSANGSWNAEKMPWPARRWNVAQTASLPEGRP